MSLSSTVFTMNGDSQKFNYSATSVASTALPDGTEAVRLVPTTDCYVKLDGTVNGASTATSMFMPAYSVEYFIAKSGQKVNAIQDSAAGTMYVTPVAKG